MLIDTSVLAALFKDRSGVVAHALRDLLDGRDYCLTRFTQMELLQGARDEKDWLRLADYLADQEYLEATSEIWAAAARLSFDLRHSGLPVRSVIDCCIAEIAIAQDATLIHSGGDFPAIASLRPLKHVQFEIHAPVSDLEPGQSPAPRS
jgi:hypothetical protein